MSTRAELSRIEALIDENAVLTRALAGAQRRSRRQAAKHAEHRETLQAEVVRLRGQDMAAVSHLAGIAPTVSITAIVAYGSQALPCSATQPKRPPSEMCRPCSCNPRRCAWWPTCWA